MSSLDSIIEMDKDLIQELFKALEKDKVGGLLILRLAE